MENIAILETQGPSEADSEDDKDRLWRPVSEEYPVHIRLLDGSGFELALYLDRLPPLGPSVRVGSDNRRAALVRRVARAVQESLLEEP